MASKSRRNKVKFKWTKELGFLLLALAVIIGLTIGLAIPTRAERRLSQINDAITEYNTANETSYYTLEKDNCFKVISHDELVSSKEKNEYMIVWYGSLKEGQFLECLSTLNELAESYEYDTVYLYLSTYIDEATEDEATDTPEYKQTIDQMEKELNQKNTTQAIDLEDNPAIFVFKNGTVIFNSQIQSQSSDEYAINLLFIKAFSLTME